MSRSDMIRFVPWPFPGDRFPPELGVVVMRTVLDGRRPACLVWHSPDNDWAIGDGVDDPNAPGACVVTHLSHLLDLDPTLGELASMPPGHRADRSGPGAAWSVVPAIDED
ncbi:hypothetical protein BH23CHL9_BH23CHL9_09810 [soil metagenome]